MDPELLNRLKKVTNLPTPPAVAAHVINLAQQPDVCLGDVAEAVTCDASLTVKIMRVANSPMYAQRRECTNLRQALVVLGLNATVTLALGFSLLPMLRRAPADNKILAYTWKRCVLSAVSARVLAQKMKTVSAEEAFLAALLQDIGILAIDRIEPNFYADYDEACLDHEKLQEYELEKLSSDHADVGAWLLDHWSLPEYLQVAVGASHTLDCSSSDDPQQSLSRCVAISGRVADLWLQDKDEEACFTETSDLIHDAIGMDRETFASVMSEIGDNIPHMAEMFETDLIDADEAQMIVERAHEALTMRNLNSINEVVQLGKRTRQLNTLASDLREESQRDALTRVANRGHLDELLAKGFAHAKRFGWTLSIAFIDLDHFKKVNDTYGHQAGDHVLQKIATLLGNQLRSSDTVGRYGGEEFVLILPGADQDGLSIVCERVLAAMRKCHHDVDKDKSIVVTASIGAACLTQGHNFDSVAEFVCAADKALYAAKNHGRDRVIQYDSERQQEWAKLA